MDLTRRYDDQKPRLLDSTKGTHVIRPARIPYLGTPAKTCGRRRSAALSYNAGEWVTNRQCGGASLFELEVAELRFTR